MASWHLFWPYPLCLPQSPSTWSHFTPACPWHVSVTSQALSIQSPPPGISASFVQSLSDSSSQDLLNVPSSLRSLLWCPWATPVNPLSGGSSSQGCSLWRWAHAWLMALGIEEGTSLLWLWWKLLLLFLRTRYLHGYAGLWHLTPGTSSMFSSYNLNNPGAEAGGTRLPHEALSQTIADCSSKFKFSASNTIGGEGTEEFI